MVSRTLISVVIPCYNEASAIPLLERRLASLGDSLAGAFSTEFWLVDDGSRDATWDRIVEIAARDSRFRGARLSRNFGQQAAITCGYGMAKGDAVVSMDADLQDPPEVIPEMLERWRAGADVVYAVRSSRAGESWLKKWSAGLFYYVLRRVAGPHIQRDCGDFRLLSRRGLKALLRIRETSPVLREIVGWIGFPASVVHYDRDPRAVGGTKYTLHKMLRLALDGIVSSSRAPLQLSYYSAALLCMVFVGCVVGHALWRLLHVEEIDFRWCIIVLAIAAFGSALMLGQALIGEYVGRMYEQCRHRPLFLVEDVTPVHHDNCRDVVPSGPPA